MITHALALWLLAPTASAQVPFQLTVTNTGAATWDEGVLAVLPGATAPAALLAIGQSPTSGDPYDTYAYVHTGCDLGQEDDANAALLIARWPALTEGSNAFRVGPLGPGASQAVAFDAYPGDVVSFVAHVAGSGDDAAVMHAVGNPADATVELFDPVGQPLTTVAFAIGGFDVNDTSPTGGGGGCAGTCPPSVPCYVSAGGGAAGGGPQPNPGGCSPRSWWVDADGDGFGSASPWGVSCAQPPGTSATPGDCDDGDPAIGDTVWWYADLDQDGFGDPGAPSSSCAQPPGLVSDATDCDDADPDNWASCATCEDLDLDGEFVGCDAYATRPGPDCDDTDPSLNAATPWFEDVDGDGFGDDATLVQQCTDPGGAVRVGGDCDDLDPSINPGGLEVCGGADEDCDGLFDDDDPSRDPSSAPTWFGDADADGFGDPATATPSCAPPPGASANGSDCDDADPDNWSSCASCVDSDGDGSFAGCDAYATRPGPDCDDTDPALNSGTVWYDDLDGDGHGDPATGVVQCAQPPAGVLLGDDCDDADPSVHPLADEVCGGPDEDCDGLIDDADPSVDPATLPTWYGDRDGDGYGDPADTTRTCAQPPSTVAAAGDCDPDDPTVHPGATETCDGADQDCDGVVDDNAVDGATWYADADGDGYGDPNAPSLGCAAPPDTVADDTDCDDGNPLTNPGGLEFCDGGDNDCDGPIDEGAFDANPWFADADGDGYGDAALVEYACTQPPDTSPVAGDCDDSNAAIHPLALERCDGVDEDCNDLVDDEVVFSSWWADLDGDGWGDDQVEIVDCIQPADSADRPGDCDDADPDVNPDGVEVPGNGIDEDCDGVDLPGPEDTGTPVPDDSSRSWDPAADPASAKPTGCGCDGSAAGRGLVGPLALFVLGLIHRRRTRVRVRRPCRRTGARPASGRPPRG